MEVRKNEAAKAMPGRIGSALSFTGTWRSYQARVLERAGTYLADGRVHIVAAPGSGKTTLGIELIARRGEPCLILAPTLTIREQWLERMREGFGAPEGLLSNDIRRPAPVTVMTYQGLHSCLKRLKEVEEDEDGSREEMDYTRFDLYGTLDRMKVGTFCLDEAHHLRSEWQKALEEVVAHCKGAAVISLTATPPYDSTPAQWNRYISLCGPIDEEISVPELVKEGSLCPHQDYVYFNMPTPGEKELLEQFREASLRMYEKLMADEGFALCILEHRCFREPEACVKIFEGNRRYLLALLCFCRQQKKRVPVALHRLAGEAALPEMDIALFNTLLQGFLFEDAASYENAAAYQQTMADSLRRQGLIHKNRVELSSSSQVNKALINSRGKLISMHRIVEAEYGSLGKELRLLILTDYIRGEYVSAIGEETKPVEELGVVPIFEYLRRHSTNQELRFAALSGSVVLLPRQAGERLLQLAEQNGQKGSLKECGYTGYDQVSLSGKGPRLTAYLTELFYQGYFQVLVGTKSLLGEGWDSPCINALILASFVGSFMLSNQMRGRAIRTMKGKPDKVSNIWHLICMEPAFTKREKGERVYRAFEQGSEDFATLRRRFEGFLGVSYTEDVIENGLDRLSFIRPPYGNLQLDAINEQMTALAADRPALKQKWERILGQLESMETLDRVAAGKEELHSAGQQKKYKKQVKKSRLAMLLAAVLAVVLGMAGAVWLAIGAAFGAAAGFFRLRSAKRREAVFTKPEGFYQAVAEAVLQALGEAGEITSPKAAVLMGQETEPADSPVTAGQEAGTEKIARCFACLQGGTEREKTVFADTLAEFLGELTEQRYLLEALEAEETDRRFYPVPEIFGRKKETAGLFAGRLAPCIGPCNLIFTRSEDGRRALLAAGIKEYKENRIQRHKQVQNRPV